MEEESLKRFTDCVYFLASPLTCKKGIGCEYRHNEIARLNPRDCWYWLSGSCLNPSCAFRHPPLDVHTQLSSESTPSEDHCSSLMNKVKVPCYFFHNGFCKKGDKCSFLHGHDGSNDSLKVSNKAATIVDSPQLDKKSSTVSNIVSVAIKTRPILSEAAPKLSDKSEIKLKEGNNKSDFKCQSASPNTSTSEFEEASKEGSIKSEAVMYTDHSSDEEVDIDIAEKDDWLESSPGFDVLVDDLSPNLGFEEDENYLVGIERDGGELNGHFLEYNHDDFAEYAGNLHEERRIGSCVEFDDEIDEQESMILRNISRHESEKMNPYLNQRHLLPVKLPMDGLRNDDMRPYPRKDRAGDDIRHYPRKDRAGDDIRHYTRKNRAGDDIRHYPRKNRAGDDIRLGDDIRPYSRNDRAGDDIRRNYSSPSMFFGHERSRQFGSERYSIGKFANNKGRFKVTKSTDQLRNPYDSRNRYLENKHSKRPVYLADRRPVTKRRINEEYSAFSGPKTLDQIKEEKRRGSGNGDSHGKFWSVSDNSEDFQGPKPLSEILKEKGKIHSVVNANNSIS